MKKLLLGILILFSGNVFSQQSCETVKDIDGNVYKTVQIGNQCWMAENLRTTHLPNGQSIKSGNKITLEAPYLYYPKGSTSNVKEYGLLYNWNAATNYGKASINYRVGGQGICPKGWHVPSVSEWRTLIDYVKTQSNFYCGGRSANVAKSLASTRYWNSNSTNCAIGNDISSNNSTGFDAVPAGAFFGSYGYVGFNGSAYFWTTNVDHSIKAYYIRLTSENTEVEEGTWSQVVGYSVRCLRDN